MSAIQQIFQRYAPEYLQRYGDAMPAVHKKVIQAIVHCRDGHFGRHVYQCEACADQHVVGCCCGNRHCPSCQQTKAEAWLHKRMQELLPCAYFLLTFTVPEALRQVLRSHQRLGYAALFQAASSALKKLARDDRFVGADQIGAFAVLHTWGRQLQYHPHLHLVVAGGGLSPDRQEWRASKAHFFVRVEPLSIIYRAKFRDAMQQAGLLDQIDPSVWQQPWTVNSQAVADGRTSVKYLAPYVFRVAISDHRILSHEDGKVTFRYRDTRTSRPRKMTLEALEFIRRFLQHVLPTGLMKVRHYGFLNANSATPLERIRELICALYEIIRDLIEPVPEPVPKPLVCPTCNQPLRWLCFIPPGVPSG